MKLLFLGTGAAEGSPAMYCRCPHCQNARTSHGKDFRTRSALRIGEEYQIDLSPDNNWQMDRCGVDMFAVEHILVTHTHEDHLQMETLVDKKMSMDGIANGKPLNIYLSRAGMAWVEKLLALLYHPEVYQRSRQHFREYCRFHPWDYFQQYQVGALRVETLKGNHWVRRAEGEESMIYLIRLPDNRHLLYALDTGWYPAETWDYLKGRALDMLILDCTFGGRPERQPHPDGHLELSSFLRMLEQMEAFSCLQAQTQIFATHINPHQGLSHAALQARFDQSDFQVTVAHDGLSI